MRNPQAAPRISIANGLLLALMPAAFGLNPVIARALRAMFEPATLTFLRWSIAALVIGGLALARGRRETWTAPWRAYAAVITLGISGMGFCAYAAYVATQTATATTVGLIYASTAAIVAAYEILRGHTPATLGLVAGLILCLAGVAALLTRGQIDQLVTLPLGTGELWALAGTMMWAFYTIIMRGQKPALTPLVMFTIMSAAAALAALPLMAWELHERPLPPLEPVHALWIAALALFTGVAAFLGYNWSLARNGAILTAATISLSPMYIAAMAIVLLDEQMAWYHGVALALTTAGLITLNAARARG